MGARRLLADDEHLDEEAVDRLGGRYAAGSRRDFSSDATMVTPRMTTITDREVAVGISRDVVVLDVAEVQQELDPR